MSTTAGGLKTHHIVSRLIPDSIGGQLGPRLMAGLALAPELVDRVRRRGTNIGFLVADQFAFGEDVPASYVEFVNNMLASTSFEVLAEFFPNFDTLDKFAALEEFAHVPTYIVSGTKDVLTSVGHSRKMASADPRRHAGRVPRRRAHGDPRAEGQGQLDARRPARRRGTRPDEPGVVTRTFVAGTAEETSALGERLAGAAAGRRPADPQRRPRRRQDHAHPGPRRRARVRGDVTSPTFVIARVHPSLVGGPALVHVDAYRLGGLAELDDLDLDTSLEEAVTVVEWGSGLAEGLAEDRLEVEILRGARRRRRRVAHACG